MLLKRFAAYRLVLTRRKGDARGPEEPDGGIAYDPAANTWKVLSAAGAPSARRFHSAIWTGTEMIIWGGFGIAGRTTGQRYDVATDAWRQLSVVNAPLVALDHSVVWTGSEMVIWGGGNAGSAAAAGARYQP
jgi:hypothetical protein